MGALPIQTTLDGNHSKPRSDSWVIKAQTKLPFLLEFNTTFKWAVAEYWTVGYRLLLIYSENKISVY